MTNECELDKGQHPERENEKEQTFVSSSRASRLQQSQGIGFTTGEWSTKPWRIA
jgi:hypothetical protein